MIEKSKYKRLRKAVQAQLEEQQTAPFVAITKGLFSYMSGISTREVALAWPYVTKELGLVDDGTHCDTWTLPGRGFMDAYSDAPAMVEQVLRARKRDQR